jgi:hypothetical protein
MFKADYFKAQLQAQIVLNGQYPKITPLFALNINWKHDRNSSNDEAVRVSTKQKHFNTINQIHLKYYSGSYKKKDIEREINLFRDSIQEDVANMLNNNKSLKRTISSLQRSHNDHDKNFDLFAKQINHLLICFDVYLESESYFLNNFEYQRLKLFPNPVR